MTDLLRMVHLSDVHLDERRRLAGVQRRTPDGRPWTLARTEACVRHVIGASLRDGVDVWLVTGDLFDVPTPTPLEERVAVDLIEDMARHAPVLFIAGNHDIQGTAASATAYECLRRRGRVVVMDRPGTVVLTAHNGDLYEGSDAAFDGDSVRAIFACVPYPRRAELAALAPEGAPAEERNAAASEALSRLVTGLRLQCSRLGVPQILLYHGNVAGARIGTQPRTMAGDLVLRPEELEGWSYVALGHIHQQQEVHPGCWYAGSIDRCDFGEEGEVKGALRVTLLAQREQRVEPIPTPATVYRTLTPAQFEGAVFEPETVHRVKAEVSEADAEPIRRRIRKLAADGHWIADALTVERATRLRDAAASADESSGDFLRRWLERAELSMAMSTGEWTREQLEAAVVAEHESVNNEVDGSHTGLEP